MTDPKERAQRFFKERGYKFVKRDDADALAQLLLQVQAETLEDVQRSLRELCIL